MKKVFPVPPPIVVPDGTELHEIIGPRVLSELNLGVNDGVSVALGRLPGGILSKVHIHPVVWHFTWVRRGELTVMMKDPTSVAPYRLNVPAEHGVLTEAGTFFQLRNETENPCEVFYIVGPAFVFEADAQGVRYNDAVVFDLSWEELAELNWKPPALPPPWKQGEARLQSLKRQATQSVLTTIQNERWSLRNGPGSVSVPSAVHRALTSVIDASDVTKPALPDKLGPPTDHMLTMADRFVDYLIDGIGLVLENDFREKKLTSYIALKCEREPSALAEYGLAQALFSMVTDYVHPAEVWHLLLFGSHGDLISEGGGSAVLRARFHVFNELLTFATTIGGGFSSAGTMENYRGYNGGIYTNPDSYRHYIPK